MVKVNNKNTRTTYDGVVLVFLLLTLNKIHTCFYCFCCWIWTSKCSLGSCPFAFGVTFETGVNLGNLKNAGNFASLTWENIFWAKFQHIISEFSLECLCLKWFVFLQVFDFFKYNFLVNLRKIEASEISGTIPYSANTIINPIFQYSFWCLVISKTMPRHILNVIFGNSWFSLWGKIILKITHKCSFY